MILDQHDQLTDQQMSEQTVNLNKTQKVNLMNLVTTIFLLTKYWAFMKKFLLTLRTKCSEVNAQ